MTYAQQQDFSSGNFWLPKCRAPVGTVAAGECLAYIEGYDAAMALVELIPGAPKVYCLPPAATYDQAIKIVVRYGDRNPHLTHLNFGAIVAGAMREAFPCR